MSLQRLLVSETLRKHRRGRIGPSWYRDETFIKVKGRLVYLYRAIDRDGNLVDVVLSEKRDYLNNHMEQDHRGIKQRIQPMGGFKRVESAKRFCQVHDEVRNFLRSRSRRNEIISLA